MALIASTPNSKLFNQSSIYLNKPQPSTTLRYNFKLPISKISLSKRLALTTHILICQYGESPNNAHNEATRSKRTTRVSAISTPGLESYSHRIWWSDVVVKSPTNVLVEGKWDSISIGNLGAVVMMHALALYAPFTFNWGAFWVAVVLYLATGLLGICLSFHRNLAHKSFKLPKWLEYVFAYCGALALQGNPIDWVSTHRYHHQFCDSEQDPHSPLEGFWFSHMNWMFDAKIVTERGVRTAWVYHITWFVNSASHVWGTQAWNTGDLSRNNWWVALLSFGEGWHNNHHAFEYSARHGLEWWQFDMTWYTIKFLQVIGLAKDVKLPTEVHKQRLAFENDGI
uniref:Fatty acid desaturase domain-containing protein n=1 Tax=Chenopodium quinoa TaxID=63459 RepID=A0A803LEB6_CHEQI